MVPIGWSEKRVGLLQYLDLEEEGLLQCVQLCGAACMYVCTLKVQEEICHLKKIISRLHREKKRNWLRCMVW